VADEATTHGIAGPSHLAIRQGTGHVSTLQTYMIVNHYGKQRTGARQKPKTHGKLFAMRFSSGHTAKGTR
jgi:hypothetical protein